MAIGRYGARAISGRGVMKFYNSGEELAKEMGVPLAKLEAAHQQHFEAAKKTEKATPAYQMRCTALESWEKAKGRVRESKRVRDSWTGH